MQAIPLQTVGRCSIPFKYGYVDARPLQTLRKAETTCASPDNPTLGLRSQDFAPTCDLAG